MEGERVGEEESERKREAGGEKKRKRKGGGGEEEKEHILGIGINMKCISGIAHAHGIMNNNLL